MASGARVRVLVVCVFGLLLAIAWPKQAEAHVDVDFDVFVGALSPHGTWFDYPRYGRVWRPAHVRHGWRPYTDGRWVWSDEYGWVWDEDEDWGWATYHYGRWLFDDRHGWFWIPGYEWAPAWVSWRYGPSYVGWVPLGPSGFSIASYPVSRWSFVSHRHFFRPRLYQYAFVPDRRVFRECRDEIWMDHRHGRWFNRGADRRHFERASRERAPVVKVRDWDRPERPRYTRDRDGGHELRMYRPKVRETRASAEPQKPRTPSMDWAERRRAADPDRRAMVETRRDRRTPELTKSTRASRSDERSLRAHTPERTRSARDPRSTWQPPAAPAPSRVEMPRARREVAAPVAPRPAPQMRERRVDRASQPRFERASRVQQQPQQIARPQAPAPAPREVRAQPQRGGRGAGDARGPAAPHGGFRGFERR
jgi:hypothetical protein